jgi:glycosyltransferase involved in cell wall biosynthesis
VSARILHIVGDSKYGGGSYIILRLAQMARVAGWEPWVLTTDPVFQQVLAENALSYTDCTLIPREIHPYKDLRALQQLTAYLRANRFDIVHTHTSKGGFIGRRAAWRAGVPAIIHTVHGFAFHEQSPPAQVRLYAAIERIAARCCHKIVTVSRYHRDWALALKIAPPSKIVAIPNGLDPARVEPTQPPDAVRRALDIRAGVPIILSTGRLAVQKGFEYLIESAAMLKHRIAQPFQVIIAGEGPLKDALQRQIQHLGVCDSVRLIGFYKTIGDLYALADLVVLPSLREGLSIALLEAMAAGKPIITTTIGSNLEATDNGRIAPLVPPKDAPALANAIQHLLGDPQRAAHYAHAARAHFMQHYTETRMLEQYRQLYCEVLDVAGCNPRRSSK